MVQLLHNAGIILAASGGRDGTVTGVVRFAPAVLKIRGQSMKIITTLATAAGLAALAACNNSPQENAADNIEANAENTADMIEANGANAAENVEANAQNSADQVRAEGENAADATRNGSDADGNSADNSH
ncbi:MAG: hypothetical protein ACJ8EQ_02720 [Sphingomicrobium sp.]